MTSIIGFRVPPLLALNSESYRLQCRVRVRSRLDGGDSVVLSSDSVEVNGSPVVGEKERVESWSNHGNGPLSVGVEEEKKLSDDVLEHLEPLWVDGYGTRTVKDYFGAVKEMIKKPDGGPPRWFSPIECGSPLKDAPVLLFLPGNSCSRHECETLKLIFVVLG